MANIAATYDASSVQVRNNIGVMAFMMPLGDQHRQYPTKGISGHVRDINGAAVQGATVLLFRTVDNAWMANTTTLANGSYYFERDESDTTSYFTLAYTLAGGSVQVHGTSDRGLVPA